MSHRVAVNVARDLARLGFPVLRFDLSGCGDSEGELGDFTISDWLDDIGAAIEFLVQSLNLSSCALWGLRTGAGLALFLSQTSNLIPFLILWQPIVDFRQYILQFLRQTTASQISKGKRDLTRVSEIKNQLMNNQDVSVFGYPMSHKLYDSFMKMKGSICRTTSSCSTLILSISLAKFAPKNLQIFTEGIIATNKASRFKHIQEEPFWDRPWCGRSPKVENSTVEWISNYHE